MGQPNYTLLKVILIGQNGVGKTSLFQRETEDNFIQNYFATIGIDFKIKFYQKNDVNIKAQIWDSGSYSGENYKTINKSYYRGGHALLICFSLNQKVQFENLSSRIQGIRSVNQLGKIFLIGCKEDIEAITPEEDILNFANKNQIKYFKTSSKYNFGVHQAFSQIIQEALNVKQNQIVKAVPVTGDSSKKKKEQCQIM